MLGPIRTLDAAFGTSCTRARTDGGARMSRQAGSRHGVQDPRPGGNQAAQGALLSGTSRCRVRAEDGRGSVRLSRGPGSEESRRQVEQCHQASGDRFLRRKAGNPGHRNDSTRFAAQARRPRDLRAGLRVQTSWHAEPVGRNRPAYREGPCARQGPPPQPRVHRIPQVSRRRLSGQHSKLFFLQCDGFDIRMESPRKMVMRMSNPSHCA